MCYSIYLSTTSQEDLSSLPSTLYRFLPLTEEDDPDILRLLDYPVQWYLQCRYGGCSCYFRHLGAGSDMNFAPPEDWFPEDLDDLEATQAVYEVLVRILAEGHRVDLVDAWTDAQPETITLLDVSVSEVPQDNFRFFENHKFNMSR